MALSAVAGPDSNLWGSVEKGSMFPLGFTYYIMQRLAPCSVKFYVTNILKKVTFFPAKKHPENGV